MSTRLVQIPTYVNTVICFADFRVATRWDTIWALVLYAKLHHLAYLAPEVYARDIARRLS